MKLNLWKFFLLSSLTIFTLQAYAEWECYASDVKGHRWASEGSTQDRANAVALNFCNAYSNHSSTCHPTQCLAK